MKLKKLAGRLHLWLGLSTGLVIFIIAITGAIYCFAPELQQLQGYRTVQEKESPFLAPSQIRMIASAALPGKTIQRIYYDAPDKSVMVLVSKPDEYSYSVFINPYNGEILKLRNNDRDFLSVSLKIHRTLMLPYGHEIIRWSTVIFLLMLISGIILWWPRKRRYAGSGFRIMWKASAKRLNYDLHRVAGFYVSWIVLFSVFTGLMFAFPVFANFVYKLTGSERSIVQAKPPRSGSGVVPGETGNGLDKAWSEVAPELHNKYASAIIVLPPMIDGPILIRANPSKETLYRSDFRYFDQHSGMEMPGAYTWGKYKDAHTTADMIRRMNYDIHTGAILGLPGRIGLFFVALIVASLPITGFCFWVRRTS